MSFNKSFIGTNTYPLPPDVAGEILSNTVHASAVMQLARRIDLPANGKQIAVITGDPVAGWAPEGTAKPISTGTLEPKTMQPYTVSVIVPFSNQFRESADALYSALVDRLPAALGKAFDRTVFGFLDAPGDKFSTLKTSPGVDISGTKTYDSFVDAMAKVQEAGGDLNGWILSPKARTTLLKAKDTQNRPLFINSAATDSAPASVLSAPAVFTPSAYNAKRTGAAEVVGFGGDWSQAVYGIVNGVQFSIADQASLPMPNDSGGGTETISLFHHNMFAVRAEAEVGFVVSNPANFVRLEHGTAA